MNIEKNKYLLMKFQSQFSSDVLVKLKKYFAEADDSAFAALNEIKLKSKIATLLLSIFLGGLCAGRFYLGDWGFAIIKMAATYIFCTIVAVLSVFSMVNPFLLVLAILIGIGIFVWYIAEIVFCCKRCSEVNYNKIIHCLHMTKLTNSL